VNDTGTSGLQPEAGPERKVLDLELLQEVTGHRFQDPSLLALALTHESYSNERSNGPENNERLEFLGDAVLGVVVCRYLYDRHPDLPEGRLAQIKAHLVSTSCLARLARNLGLGEHILLGRGETLAHGEGRRNILADTLEALIGALYLDGGLDVVVRFVLSLLQEAMDRMEGSQKDFKSLLQECTQRLHKSLPDYEVVREEGPPHERVFVVQVGFLGEILGQGQGRSKREASQKAACEALEVLRGRAGFDLGSGGPAGGTGRWGGAGDRVLMDFPIQSDATGVSFAVRVIPRAQKEGFHGVREGALMVRLAAPPVEGRANAALQALLAAALGVRRSQISLRTGEKSRTKIVRVEGVRPEAVRALADGA